MLEHRLWVQARSYLLFLLLPPSPELECPSAVQVASFSSQTSTLRTFPLYWCMQATALYMCFYVIWSQCSRSLRQDINIHCTCELLRLFYIFVIIYLSFCIPKKRDKSQHSGDRHHWRRVNIWGKSAIAYLIFQDVCISFILFKWQQWCVWP